MNTIAQRFLVWSLASMSFACLLGAFFEFWSMQAFACLIFPPATIALFVLARRDTKSEFGPRSWIIEGALAGVIAAIIYDLFRLPFVLAGYPLFGVFPKFGQLLLHAAPTDFSPAVQIAGWTYHFANGASLGIMFLAMVPRPKRKSFYIGAVVWALVVEALLLLSPYYSFFKLHLDPTAFLYLTLSAHAVFGLALGWWLSKRWAAKPGFAA